MNKKILINLKDWFNLEENEKYAKAIKGLDVIVFPSILYLYLYGNEKGVQDFNYERGPHTGKISLSRLVEFGISWALINHRENKVQDIHELISKIECALSKKVKPIVCLDSIDEIPYEAISKYKNKIQIAYEPIKVISAEEASKNIKELYNMYNQKIIFGNNINKDNILDYCFDEVEGFLISRDGTNVKNLKIILEKVK